jgi:hypothetical protein
MKTDSLAGVTNPLRHVWMALLLTTLVATATERQNGPAERPAQPYRGRVEDRIYSNDSIGFSYQLPEHFFVHSDLPERLPAGSVLLMIADQRTGRPWRNRIILLADDARKYTRTTKEYAAKIVRAMPSKLNVIILRDAYSVAVGGHEFYRVDYKKTDSGQTIYESFVCVRQRDFFVNWTLLAFSQAELEPMAASIQTVSFR